MRTSEMEMGKWYYREGSVNIRYTPLELPDTPPGEDRRFMYDGTNRSIYTFGLDLDGWVEVVEPVVYGYKQHSWSRDLFYVTGCEDHVILFEKLTYPQALHLTRALNEAGDGNAELTLEHMVCLRTELANIHTSRNHPTRPLDDDDGPPIV